MKHPRLILWYATVVPMTVVYTVIALPMVIIGGIFAHLTAVGAVIDNLLMRYELWAKYNEKGSLYNCPWNYTLREVYLNALRRSY
jgi:hypothetical protein